jgi:solute carrier family 24 (sodium/potassium/calcium exchanger), member 6
MEYIAFHLFRVTLIAFANGAPDVMTAFVASGNESGILIAVGSIFGAGLFITTVVLGRVIYTAKIIKVNSILCPSLIG